MTARNLTLGTQHLPTFVVRVTGTVDNWPDERCYELKAVDASGARAIVWLYARDDGMARLRIEQVSLQIGDPTP